MITILLSYYLRQITLQEALAKDHDEAATFKINILDISAIKSYKGKNKTLNYFEVTGGEGESKVVLRVYLLQLHKTLRQGKSYIVKQVSEHIIVFSISV